jgi:hypothetical protein
MPKTVEPDTGDGNMGLGQGMVAKIANLGAIILICLMFYQDRHTTNESAKEDRAMFRSAIERIETASREQNATHAREMSEQSKAVRELTEQVKRLVTK